VHTENNSSTSTSAGPATLRSGWAFLILVTLFICYFSHLGALGFVGPDEPRYAWVARDMAESGDWITPRLYGKPWFEKPVLYYWGAAASFKLFGVSEAAARLPSAISALLATLALAWLALRLYGAETARWLLLLLPTTVGMIGFSRAASTDMPFSAMLTIAMVCAAAVIGLTRPGNASTIPRTPWLSLVSLGFFLGLAVLAKGPAAIILSGGAIFFWALFTRRWRDALRCLHPVAIATFCLTALPWYILCSRRNPDFFHVFIVEHNFRRFFTPEFQHLQPFWYYAPVLLVAILPWTVLFFWAVARGISSLQQTRRLSEPTCFLVCWAAFCVLFFSISRSKLPGYILPALPAVSLILAHADVHITFARPWKFLRLCLLIAALVLLLPLLLSALAPHFFPQNHKFGVGLWILLALAGMSTLLSAAMHSSNHVDVRRFTAASFVLPILLAVAMLNYFLPLFFRSDPSGRSLATELHSSGISAQNLRVAGMGRGLNYSLNFYMREEIKIWDKDHPVEGYLLIGGPSCQGRVSRPFVCQPVTFPNTEGWFLYYVLPGALASRQVQ
jgi:4-amino-4-deoxy-L-arabinose transferase-like glycosyltransferase